MTARLDPGRGIDGLKPSYALELPRLLKHGPTASTAGVDRPSAERRATGAAIAEPEAEIPDALGNLVHDPEKALQYQSFHDRIAEKPADGPGWAEASG